MANVDTMLDLSQLLESGKFSDLVLKCQRGGELKCHQTIVFEQCGLLKHKLVTSGAIMVEGPFMIWKLILKFLYTGNYEIFRDSNRTPLTAHFYVMKISKTYGIQDLELRARAALFTDAKSLCNNVDLMRALRLFCKWDTENTYANEVASLVRPLYFEDPRLREKLDPILAAFPGVALQVPRQITSGPFEGKRIVFAAATSPIEHPTTSMANQAEENVASPSSVKRENGESETRPQEDNKKRVKTEDDAESTVNTSENGTVRCE